MKVEEIMKVVQKGAVESRHCWEVEVTSGSVYTDDQNHWDFINDVMKGYV